MFPIIRPGYFDYTICGNFNFEKPMTYHNEEFLKVNSILNEEQRIIYKTLLLIIYNEPINNTQIYNLICSFIDKFTLVKTDFFKNLIDQIDYEKIFVLRNDFLLKYKLYLLIIYSPSYNYNNNNNNIKCDICNNVYEELFYIINNKNFKSISLFETHNFIFHNLESKNIKDNKYFIFESKLYDLLFIHISQESLLINKNLEDII